MFQFLFFPVKRPLRTMEAGGIIGRRGRNLRRNAINFFLVITFFYFSGRKLPPLFFEKNSNE